MGNDIIKISPSILSANFLILGEEIKQLENAGADSLHLDDNHMAPNHLLGLNHQTNSFIDIAPLDAHLMIDAPWLFLMIILLVVSKIHFILKLMTKRRSTMMLSKKSRTVTNVDYVKLENDIYN